MSDLKDPTKPAGHLIEVNDDGSALRNDGVELKPASQNPWYVLATVYGEFEDGYDEDLAAKNRRIWNGWACAGKPDEERAELAEKTGLPVEELAELSAKERKRLKQAFADRLPKGTDVPNPDQRIDMSEIHISNTVVLEMCIFPTHADFQSAAFSWSANFSSAAFSGSADFSSAAFSGPAYFNSAAFSGYAFFNSASFSWSAFFNSASFSGYAYFNSAAFSGPAYFNSAAFSGYANFQSAAFNWSAFFNSASFSGDAFFNSASFSRFADFQSAAFSGYAFFNSASFSRDANFQSAAFSGDADFQSAAFSGDADFQSAAFSGRADFSNETFNGQTVFVDAKFHKQVPKFYHRTMHQDTEFTADEANWPTPGKATANDSIRAYTRLHQIMKELNNLDGEHFFFRQQMRCKLLIEEDWWNKLPIRLYGALSSYGYSVALPAAWLAMVIGLGWGIIGSFLRFGQAVPQTASIWEGLGVSISNTFPFLGFQRKMHPEFFTQAPAWLDALSAGQSILGIILLFFLGLGLRNRFRIK